MVVDASLDRITEVLKALAEPARRRILDRLAVEELCVCHLVDDLGLAQPLVSHHLKVLRDAGIVESERFKQWTYHRLVPDALAAVARDLAALARASKAAPRNRRPCC
jgi:DNA-binding transcriptional ArsR family regulator